MISFDVEVLVIGAGITGIYQLYRPGKPRRYLINAGGRPKLFTEIARVRDNDYCAFRLSRSGSPESSRFPGVGAGER